MGGETTIVARGGRCFAPQMDLLVPIVTEYRYFPRILWLHCHPVRVGSLEIAWWCRDWIGIMRSWLTCKTNILVMVSSEKKQWGL